MTLLKTHLNSWHHGHATKMTDFAGWEMPFWYAGITTEHLAVRNGAGFFDVGHMGRFFISGPEAEQFLEGMVTNSVAGCLVSGAKYAMVCNEGGGIKDDVTYFRLGGKEFMLVVNASNREKIWGWLMGHLGGRNVEMRDATFGTSMVAVQGPRARAIVENMAGLELSAKWGCSLVDYGGTKTITSGSGYTGEDGFEITVLDSTPEKAEWLVGKLVEGGAVPCGLGCRGTLRLEAGNVLYGHEIDEETTPMEAGLDFAVKFDKGDFIGRDALLDRKKERKLVGAVFGRGIPRDGNELLDWSLKKIGKVTSGAFSPLIKKGIALAYVPADYSGAEVRLDIRGVVHAGKIVKPPFYDTERYGRKRKVS